jgi:hypothetical protein
MKEDWMIVVAVRFGLFLSVSLDHATSSATVAFVNFFAIFKS